MDPTSQDHAINNHALADEMTENSPPAGGLISERKESPAKVKLATLDEVGEETSCIVCQEEYVTGEWPELPIKLRCGRFIGSQCMMKWLSPLSPQRHNSCPMCRVPIIERRQNGVEALQSLDPSSITNPIERRMVTYFQEHLTPGARQPDGPPTSDENASGGLLNDRDEACFQALMGLLWGDRHNLERALHERRRLSEHGT